MRIRESEERIADLFDMAYKDKNNINKRIEAWTEGIEGIDRRDRVLKRQENILGNTLKEIEAENAKIIADKERLKKLQAELEKLESELIKKKALLSSKRKQLNERERELYTMQNGLEGEMGEKYAARLNHILYASPEGDSIRQLQKILPRGSAKLSVLLQDPLSKLEGQRLSLESRLDLSTPPYTSSLIYLHTLMGRISQQRAANAQMYSQIKGLHARMDKEGKIGNN